MANYDHIILLSPSAAGVIWHFRQVEKDSMESDAIEHLKLKWFMFKLQNFPIKLLIFRVGGGFS